jgi:hypothetical protein
VLFWRLEGTALGVLLTTAVSADKTADELEEEVEYEMDEEVCAAPYYSCWAD